MMEKMLVEMMLMPNDGDEMIGESGGGADGDDVDGVDGNHGNSGNHSNNDGDDSGDVCDYGIGGGGDRDGSHIQTHTLRSSHDSKTWYSVLSTLPSNLMSMHQLCGCHLTC